MITLSFLLKSWMISLVTVYWLYRASGKNVFAESTKVTLPSSSRTGLRAGTEYGTVKDPPRSLPYTWEILPLKKTSFSLGVVFVFFFAISFFSSFHSFLPDCSCLRFQSAPGIDGPSSFFFSSACFLFIFSSDRRGRWLSDISMSTVPVLLAGIFRCPFLLARWQKKEPARFPGRLLCMEC